MYAILWTHSILCAPCWLVYGSQTILSGSEYDFILVESECPTPTTTPTSTSRQGKVRTFFCENYLLLFLKVECFIMDKKPNFSSFFSENVTDVANLYSKSRIDIYISYM
jgi:hypothetical protein